MRMWYSLHFYDSMKIWEHDLAAATLPIAVMNVPIDKEDGDASSDDEDGVELEPAEELEDPGFLADLDCVFGDSD
jgi:hypothetical protein